MRRSWSWPRRLTRPATTAFVRCGIAVDWADQRDLDHHDGPQRQPLGPEPEDEHADRIAGGSLDGGHVLTFAVVEQAGPFGEIAFGGGSIEQAPRGGREDRTVPAVDGLDQLGAAPIARSCRSCSSNRPGEPPRRTSGSSSSQLGSLPARARSARRRYTAALLPSPRRWTISDRAMSASSCCGSR